MRPELTLDKATDRLTRVQQAIAEGRWQPSPDTLGIVLRHTVGILTALQSAVVVGAQASS